MTSGQGYPPNDPNPQQPQQSGWGQPTYGAPAPMPYGQPYGQQPPARPGSAKAAAILLAIIGALFILGGVGMAILFASMGETLLEEPQMREAVAEAQMDPQQFMNIMAGCFGVCGGVMGLLYLVLAPFVWKASKIASILAIILISLTGLLLLINVLTSLAGGGEAMIGGIILMLPLILLIVTLVLVIKAMKDAPNPQHQQHYLQQQAAWQQYAQQEAQRGYGQGQGPYPPQG